MAENKGNLGGNNALNDMPMQRFIEKKLYASFIERQLDIWECNLLSFANLTG